jgi:meso-butanediol dehydrogenase/(S,S)-butanediol dehydrogenase/diacetyl reductase
MLWRSGPDTGVRQADRLGGAPQGETYKKFVDGTALGRAQTPEDVAAFVSYLAGPDSDSMTGQSGLIDGGLVYR